MMHYTYRMELFRAREHFSIEWIGLFNEILIYQNHGKHPFEKINTHQTFKTWFPQLICKIKLNIEFYYLCKMKIVCILIIALYYYILQMVHTCCLTLTGKNLLHEMIRFYFQCFAISFRLCLLHSLSWFLRSFLMFIEKCNIIQQNVLKFTTRLVLNLLHDTFRA